MNMLSAMESAGDMARVLVDRLDPGARAHPAATLNRTGLAFQPDLALESGTQRPPKAALISVDLPAPLSPMTAQDLARVQFEIAPDPAR